MKRCSACREQKPFSEFNKNRARHDGVQNACRECQSKYDRGLYASDVERRKAMADRSRRLRQSRRAHVTDYLSRHPCVDCGEADPVVLDFDHVRGTKTQSVSDMAAWGGSSLERLKTEIAKCEIRCANCHRRRHHRGRGRTA